MATAWIVSASLWVLALVSISVGEWRKCEGGAEYRTVWGPGYVMPLMGASWFGWTVGLSLVSLESGPLDPLRLLALLHGDGQTTFAAPSLFNTSLSIIDPRMSDIHRGPP